MVYSPIFFSFIDLNCSPSPWLSYEEFGRSDIIGPDDGIVPLSSAQSTRFIPLGITHDCHTNLFSDKEYDMAKNVLK